MWIICINVVVCINGLSYSCFMNGLFKFGIILDCKVLVDIVVYDVVGFVVLVEKVKGVLVV